MVAGESRRSPGRYGDRPYERENVLPVSSIKYPLRLSKNRLLVRLMENVQMQGFRNPEE